MHHMLSKNTKLKIHELKNLPLILKALKNTIQYLTTKIV